MKAAVTQANYVSYMVSPYNAWFRELGYPELDIQEYDDGEFAIIQYHRSPVVPALTPWSHVLTKLRHIEKSLDFCKRYSSQLDLEKRHVWDEQDKLERRAREDMRTEDEYAEDWANRAFKVIKGNPALYERIAKNGLKEMGLRRISRNIANHHFR